MKSKKSIRPVIDPLAILSLNRDRLAKRRADCLTFASNQALAALRLRYRGTDDNTAEIARLEACALRDDGEARGYSLSMVEIDHVLSIPRQS